MKLFDFAKNIGTKVFGEKDKPAEKIREYILADNPGIEHLDVMFNKGTVALSGEAKSREALEKAVLLAGNLEGVEKVMAVTVKETEMPKVEYYEIARGDTLSGIAKKYYGDPKLYTRLFDANREVIKDPEKIFPGQKIRIPMDTKVAAA